MKKMLFNLLCMALPVIAISQQEYYLLIGTYTSGKSEGIYVYKFNSGTGDTSFVSKVAANNPSYLAVSRNSKYVYAVNEDGEDKGSIAAFEFDKKKGTLQFLNKQSSGGDHPCYVAIDKSGKWVTAANYSGGSFSLLGVSPDGYLRAAERTINHSGSGPDKQRQDKPHVHSTVFSPDEKYLLVQDLGIDKIMIYAFENKTGTLKPAKIPSVSTVPGSGPRHFEFHPSGDYGYLIEEMSGHITAYQYSKGKLQFLQTISAIKEGYKGPIGSADIHVSPDGRFLYASNRGESNDIAIFAIDKSTGKLTLKGHQPVLGRTPRNFSIDPSGQFLLVANQNSNDIVIFKRDPQTGLLTDSGKKIEVDKPVCLKWVAIK
jgi:6-phosphogluconolactonase